jgi:DNA primase
MRISEETINRVREAVDIVDVIGSYVPLKRAGANYRGLSPFNKEKTPSFYVLPQKQIFKCFSSGHGGNVFKFLMLYENIDFPAAVRKLAERANIPIEAGRGGEDQEARTRRQELVRVHDLLSLYWREILEKHPAGEEGRRYLKHRDMPLGWIREFGLGFAPMAWDDTVLWAKREKIPAELAEQAGVVVRREGGGFYDRFRGRLMFPIRNESGQVIAFSGRLLESDAKAAKYVNSPETPLFTKSKVLYGFDRAKRAILNEKSAILCEGQIDVLRCHASGLLNVVAPLGTSFTEEQARLLRTCTERVIICLDADAAGQRAAGRTARLLLQEQEGLEGVVRSDLGIEVAPLPQGHDPDSLIRAEGVEAFKAVVRKPRELLDFQIDYWETQHEKGSMTGRRQIIQELVEFLSGVPSPILRRQMLVKAALRLEMPENLLEEELKRRRAPARREIPGSGEAPSRPPEVLKPHPAIEQLAELAVGRPELVPEIQRRLDPVWIRDLAGAGFLEKLMDLYNHEGWHDLPTLMDQLETQEQNFLAGLDYEGLENRGAEDILEALDRLCDKLRLNWLQQSARTMARRLADKTLAPEEYAKILAEQARILQAQRELLQRKKSLTEPR